MCVRIAVSQGSVQRALECNSSSPTRSRTETPFFRPFTWSHGMPGAAGAVQPGVRDSRSPLAPVSTSIILWRFT